MRSPRLDRVAVTAALVGLVGLVVSAAAVWPRQPPDTPSTELPAGQTAAPATARHGSGATHNANQRADAGRQHTAAAPTPGAPPAPRPVTIAIDSIDYEATVRPVGVDPAGVMRLPADPARLGWYRYGPAPLEAGSTVLAGHLDSVQYGVGPLVRLRDVDTGDSVAVSTAKGETATYVVSSIDRYNRSALPPEIFAREGPRRLRLITCGGEYYADAGGYQHNLVVTAVPV